MLGIYGHGLRERMVLGSLADGEASAVQELGLRRFQCQRRGVLLNRLERAWKNPRYRSHQLGTAQNAAAAVDGNRYVRLGYHSATSTSRPQLTLDLGSSHYVDHVIVYGRGDCCFSQSIPLSLAVSHDLSSFEDIAVREKPFTQYQPWVIEVDKKTHYICLTILPGHYLVASEVEIFGE